MYTLHRNSSKCLWDSPIDRFNSFHPAFHFCKQFLSHLPLDSSIPLDDIASINAQHPDDPVTRQVDFCNELILATIGTWLYDMGAVTGAVYTMVHICIYTIYIYINIPLLKQQSILSTRAYTNEYAVCECFPSQSFCRTCNIWAIQLRLKILHESGISWSKLLWKAERLEIL